MFNMILYDTEYTYIINKRIRENVTEQIKNEEVYVNVKITYFLENMVNSE